MMHGPINIGNYVFRRADNFKYLGAMGNKTNSRSTEEKARLIIANRPYYGSQNHMKSRTISRNNKTLLHKTDRYLHMGQKHGRSLSKMNTVLVFLGAKSSGKFMVQ